MSQPHIDLDREIVKLRANIRLNVIQRLFRGFVALFEAVVTPTADLVGWMKDSVPGFAERIGDYEGGKDDVPYSGNKWTLRNLTDVDKNSIVQLFGQEEAYSSDEKCDFEGDRVVDMYVICAIFLHGRKGCVLPKTKVKDEHGLWVAFHQLFPSSAAAMAGAPTETRKRAASTEKQGPAGGVKRSRKDAVAANLEARVAALEEAVRRLTGHVGTDTVGESS